jgi:hypothetical protein
MNVSKRIRAVRVLFGFSLLLVPVAAAHGAAVIYQATGARPEDIQPKIDEFKRDILFGIGNPTLPPQRAPGSFAEATFDDLPASSSATTHSFSLTSGGVNLLAFAGTQLWLSAGTATGAGENLLFGDVSPQYPQTFQAFSSPSLLAAGLPLGVIIIQRPAGANAFGAVFSDVDFEGGARFEGLINTPSLQPALTAPFSFNIPASPGQKMFSFFGVIFVGFETINVVAVRLPGLLEQSALPGESQLRDFIAVDNIIIGAAVPEPSSFVLSAMALAGFLLNLKTRRKRSF